MFQKGYDIARQFTLPIVLSKRTIGGKCTSSIGTAVVVNDEGWILSAGHVLSAIPEAALEQSRTMAYSHELQAIENDPTLNHQERRRRRAMLKKPKSTDLDRWSVWGGQQLVFDRMLGLDPVDLAVAKLASFDPSSVSQYPVFKDPEHGVEPGASLCRIGFPFHAIEPTYDEATQSFQLPEGSIPMPLFANEGILARMGEMIVLDEKTGDRVNTEFPLKLIETTSPGIRGQSGGPIFDTEGRVWGIQSHTVSYELDFDTKDRQYLNVGVGVHVATILGFLDKQGIKYAKA